MSPKLEMDMKVYIFISLNIWLLTVLNKRFKNEFYVNRLWLFGLRLHDAVLFCFVLTKICIEKIT